MEDSGEEEEEVDSLVVEVVPWQANKAKRDKEWRRRGRKRTKGTIEEEAGGGGGGGEGERQKSRKK